MKLKIIQKTPIQLKLKFQVAPGSVIYWLFGSLFITLGLFTVVALARTTSLTCVHMEATPDSCTLTQSHLLTSKIQDIPLRDVEGAEVIPTKTPENNPLVLLTRRGTIDLNFTMASRNQKQVYAAQVNDFISKPTEKRLTIQEDSKWLAYSLGSLGIAVGVFCILIIQSITLSFDKTFDRLTIEQAGWFSKKVTNEALGNILKLDIESLNVKGVTSCNIILILRSGKRLPIASYPLFNQESAAATCRYIKDFLHLPTNS